MRLRFTLLFLLLVAVPLALMGWVGVILLQEQPTQTRSAWLSVIDVSPGAHAGDSRFGLTLQIRQS